MNFKGKSVKSQSLKNTTKITSNIKKMKHKKLDEDWFEAREQIQDGMRFSAKYLGITLVDEPKGDVLSAAVQRILTMSKGTKKPAVQLMISSKGIKVLDQTSSRIINDIEIQRISFCAALKHHMKVFAFVARNDKNEKMECYAYLCNTSKEAQTLTVTVAQSFKIAFEIGEEESSMDGVENDTQDSDVRVIKGEKKSAQITMPIAVEQRYQRFSSDSNPFAISDHEVSSPADPNQLMNVNVKEKGGEGSSVGDFGDVFIFTSPLPTSPQHPATPKSAPPIIPLRPPPASTRQSEKSSSRRPVARPTSVGSPLPNSTILHQVVQTPSPIQSTPDVEDWDQGFAESAQITMPIAVEKRYQRFSSDSNPFATSDHEVSSPADPNQLKEKQGEGSSVGEFGDVFIFTSPLPTTPQHSATPKSAPPITPLRPPPASTRQSEKSSSRRPLARPTSVGSPLPNSTILHQVVQTPSPIESAPDVEDWDQGFADLALSRTQEKPSSTEDAAPKTTTKISYPPSNPFSSPSNPFHS